MQSFGVFGTNLFHTHTKLYLSYWHTKHCIMTLNLSHPVFMLPEAFFLRIAGFVITYSIKLFSCKHSQQQKRPSAWLLHKISVLNWAMLNLTILRITALTRRSCNNVFQSVGRDCSGNETTAPIQFSVSLLRTLRRHLFHTVYLLNMQRCHWSDLKNTGHKAGLHYKSACFKLLKTSSVLWLFQFSHYFLLPHKTRTSQAESYYVASCILDL